MSRDTAEGKFGTLRGDLTGIKDKGDFWLTRFPSLYLTVERYREWVNWDKRVYLSFVRPRDTVLDIGANVGAHSVFFSHLVGPSGRVLSYEPIPANVAALRALVARRARFDNVTVIPVAIGNPGSGEHTAILTAPDGDLTQASRASQAAGSWSDAPVLQSFECPITRLDADPRVEQLARIDFMKLDVEGGELDVLFGARTTVSRHHPLIYCEAYEAWTRSFGHSPAALFTFVESLGYVGARVISRGELFPWSTGETPSPEWFKSSADILFFSHQHVELVARFDARYPHRVAARAPTVD